MFSGFVGWSLVVGLKVDFGVVTLFGAVALVFSSVDQPASPQATRGWVSRHLAVSENRESVPKTSSAWSRKWVFLRRGPLRETLLEA